MHHVQQSPRDPGFVQNPYPFYENLRALGGMAYWDDYAMPAIVDHAAVQTVLRGRAFARVAPEELAVATPWDDLPAFATLENASMLSNEAPRHPVLRKAVLRAFSSARIQAMTAEIRALCHGLIDRFPDGPFDLLTHYATPVPVKVIARMLGEPEGSEDDLLKWSHAMVRLYTPAPDADDQRAAETAAAQFDAHARALLARQSPGAQTLAAALMQEVRADRMTEAEAVGTCVLLLNAGHEATVHTIGNTLALLLARSDAAALCSQDAVAATVEEALRLDPPLHVFTRWVTAPVEVAGHMFQRGDQIACLLAGANRDPAVFEDPAAFRPMRDTRALTSFGAGVHFCLGAPLARLEIQIALQTLFVRCPGLTLAEPPRFAPTYHFHGLDRLMVTTNR